MDSGQTLAHRGLVVGCEAQLSRSLEVCGVAG
jgi:hypothetical protein